MREIKFRAWCPRRQTMLNPFSLEEALDELPARWHKGEDVFMQFTGLKDKNGKGIYEGDIMNMGRYRGIVRWEWLKGRWELSNKFDIRQGYKSLTEPVARASEIIGNIYENPDLLTPPNPQKK